MISTTVDQARANTRKYLWGADTEDSPADDGLTYGECTEETQRKAAAVMLYVAARCADDEHFTMTRLNTTLWRAEMRCFAETDMLLTGSRYVALESGPVLDGYKGVLRLIVSEGKGEINCAGQRQVLVPASSEVVTMSGFLSKHQAIVDEVVIDDMGKDTRTVSDESHGIAWYIAATDPALGISSMAYELFCFSDEPVSDEDLAESRARYGG